MSLRKLFVFIIVFIILVSSVSLLNLTAKAASTPGWDFEDHTYTHDSLISLTTAQIVSEMQQQNDAFQTHGLPLPQHLAYPSGDYNAAVISVVRNYRLSGRTAGANGGLESYPVADWYQLSATTIDSAKTVAQLQSTIDSAIVGKKLLTLFTHEITDTPSQYDCTPATLSAVLDYLSTKQSEGQLSVLPIRDAYNAFTGDKAVVVIAFDDAYLTDYTEAWPLFKAHNMVGTSFIAGDIIEHPTDYDPGDGSVQHQRLTWFMVMQMAGVAGGYTSYSVTYNPYANVQWGSWSPLKTEIHCHTTQSDGLNTPLQMANAYSQAGFNALGFSDHDHLTYPWSAYGINPAPGGMIAIPNEEVTRDNSHMGAPFGTTQLVGDNYATPQAEINAINAEGGLAIICHPYWYGYTGDSAAYTLTTLDTWTGFQGTEIYNPSEGDNFQNFDFQLWDHVLTDPNRAGQNHIWGFAADDAHDTFGVERGWLSIYSPSTSLADLKSSIQTGSFLSVAYTKDDHTGEHIPAINSITQSGSLLTVDTSAPILWYADGLKLVGTGNTLDLSALPQGLTYVRAELNDGSAYVFTQPIFISVFGLNSIGSATYPTTNVGHTSSSSLTDLNGGLLTASKYTITAPLTVNQIRTYGTVSGNVKVSIYADSSGSPGARLFTEIASAVAANTWSSITIPTPYYLAPGTYWIVLNTNALRVVQYGSATGSTTYTKSLTYTSSFPTTGGTGWVSHSNVEVAAYFVGVSIEGYAKATKAVLSNHANVQSLNFYSHATGNFRLAIYSDSSGNPGALQWQSGSWAATANAWKTVTIASGTPTSLTLNAGTYWLAWQWDSVNSGPSYSIGSSGDGKYIAQAYGSFPSSWSGGTSSSEKWSIYATCTGISLYPASGSPGSSVTISGSGFAANSLLSATLGGSTVSLSGIHTTDASGNVPAGVTFTVPASSTGSKSVIVTDASSNSASATFTVNSGGLDHFGFGNIGSPQSTNTGFSVTVTALDASNNIVTGWAGSVSLTESNSGLVSPSSVTISSGGQVTSTVSVSYSGTSVTLGASGGGKTGTSNSFTVNGFPSVSVVPTSAILDVGQSKVFTATAAGGSGVYSNYQWFVNGGLFQSGAALTFTYDAVSVGSASITVRVTDSLGTSSALSNAASVSVNVVPSVSVVPTSAILDVGQSKVFTATAAGGSGVYSNYQWFVNGGLFQSGAALTFTYDAVSVGSASITVRVTDSLGVTSAISNSASVIVTAAPTVSILPVGPVTLSFGGSQLFTAMVSGGSGVIHYQWYLAGLTLVGSDSNTYTFSSAIVGSYSVTCRVTDSADLPFTSGVSNAVSVNVVDSVVPVITLSGSSPVTVEVGSVYTDAGATATDNYNGVLTGSIVVVNSVNSAVVGSYTVTYNVHDSSGNAAVEVTRTVNVVDTTKPIITMLGVSPVTVQVGSVYTDAGATALDNYDGPIAVTVGGSVNSAVVGQYTVTFDAVDAHGNHAVQVTRTVNVVDTTAPVITLIGSTPVTIQVRSVYVDAGATATDNYDLSVAVTVSGSVNTAVVGDYTLTYNAVDSNGNHAAPVTRIVHVVDNAAPLVTITAPVNGATYRTATVPVAAFTVDDSLAVVVESGYSTAVGTHTYTVTATDAVGNVGSASVTYTVDNAAPLVTITAPVNGATYRTATVPVAAFTVDDSLAVVVESGYSTAVGTHTYTVTATDAVGNVGSASVTYTVDNAAPLVTITAPVNGATYRTATVPVAAFTVDDSLAVVVESGYSTAVGTHTYTVTATDAVGNVGSASVTYTVDNAAPLVTITAPVNGATYRTATVPVAAFTVDDSLAVVVESGYSTAVGTHTYTVTATDAVGNVGSASVTYTVDNAAPLVTITAPVNGATYRTATVPVAAFTVDDSLAVVVESGYSTAVGTHTYTVTATDAVGNVGSASVTYTVDNAAPLVTITAPVNGATYRTATVPVAAFTVDDSLAVVVESGYSTAVGTHTYTVTATDAVGNVGSASVTYTVDNAAPLVTITAPVNGATYRTATVPVAAFTVDDSLAVVVESGYSTAVGTHTYTVTATDAVGNVGSASVTYTVDNAAPLVTITAPVNGATYRTATVPVAAFTVDDSLAVVVESGYSTAVGTHTYTVTATDAVGNVGSASVTYTVDNAAPLVTITAPVNGATYRTATVPVAAFTVDDSLAVVVESGYSTAVGTHTYTVTATDAVGNVGSASVTYTVDNAAPLVTITAPVNGATYRTATVPVAAFTVDDSLAVVVESGYSTAVGTHTYTVTATDAVGNVGSASVTYTVDNAAPLVTITAPVNGATYRTATVPVAAFTVDDSLAVVVESGYSTAVGTHTYTVTATDAVGNVGSASVTYTVDNAAPLVTITAPVNGATYRTATVPVAAFTVDDSLAVVVESGYSTAVGTHTYTVTATDAVGNVGSASVTYTVDNAAPLVTITAPVNGATYRTATVPVAAFTVDDSLAVVVESGYSTAVGTHTYTVTATDAVGNVGSASVTYTVDNAAPLVTITAPVNGATYRTATVPVAAFTVDDSLAVVVESGYSTAVGTHTYTVTATDAVGNVGSASVTYTVDNAAPLVTITAPVNGATYRTATVPVAAFTVDDSLAVVVESGYSTAVGTHTYTVTATDAVGNVGSASVTYTVDNAAPLVTITAPVNGATYRTATVPVAAFTVDDSLAVVVESGYSTAVGTHTYTVTATDAVGNVGSASVTYTVDNAAPLVTITAPVNGATYRTATVPVAAFTVDDSLAVVVESGYSTAVGTHTYTVTATDAVGNVGSASVTYTVDNAAPLVTITAPVNGATYRTATVPVAAFTVDDSLAVVVESGYSTAVGTHTYTVTATDAVGNVGSASVTYTVDNAAPLVTITAPVNGATYRTATVPVAAFTVDDSLAVVVESGYSTAVGTHTYTVTATDAVGNVGSASVTYTVDNAAPLVTITAPVNGATYRTATVPVAAFTVDDSLAVVVESGYSTAVGTHTYTVTATDAVGNVGSASVTYTVDNAAPLVTITAPVNGATYRTATVPVAAFTVDDSLAVVVESGYSTAVGTHTYTVTATDAVGNVGSASVTYTVDNAAPLVTITAPVNGATYRTATVPVAAFTVDDSLAVVVESGYSTAVGTHTYTVTATDAVGNVGSASVTYTVDNAAPLVTITAPVNGATYRTATVPVAAFTVDDSLAVVVESGYSTAVGTHTYTVTATDAVGNVGSASVTYTVDNAAPLVTITAPVNGATYRTATVPVAAFTVDDSLAVVVESGYSTAVGTHTYTVTATDAVGNVGSASVTYTVDNAAPLVTITAPVNGATYRTATVPVAAFTVDDSLAVVVESGYSTAVGTHTYTVTATDAVGNVGSASVTYTVDNAAPLVTITAPVNGATYRTATVPVAAFTVDDSLAVVVESGYSTAVGTHTYTVTATDAVGNVGSASVTYTVDNAAPLVTITAPVNGATYRTATVPVAAFTVDDSLAVVVESGYSTAVGTHTYTVTATDAVGNVGSASVTYTVDNAAPLVTITAPVNGATYRTATVPVAAFTVDDSLAVVVESGYSTAVGTHTYTVTATDAVGNVGSASVTYTVDNAAPLVTITAPVNGATYRTATVPVAAFTVDDSLAVVVESGYSTAVGTHTYTVTATDAVGNVGSASVTYTVDVDNGLTATAALVVRGADNTVYYRTYDSVSATWNSWVGLPGSTVDSPAAVVCGTELHIVVRGMDGITLYHGYVDLNSNSFSGWTWISGTTPSPPTLASNGNALTLVVRGADNSIYYRVYSLQTRAWGSWQALPSGSTSDKVSAVMRGSVLDLVVRGYSATDPVESDLLWHGSVDVVSGVFSGWSWIPGSVTSSPTLSAWQNGNGLCLVVRGSDNSIYINRYTGGAWQGWVGLAEGSTNESPAATVVGDKLYLIVVGMDRVTLWQGNLDLNTYSFSGWSWLSGTTPSKPILTS